MWLWSVTIRKPAYGVPAPCDFSNLSCYTRLAREFGQSIQRRAVIGLSLSCLWIKSEKQQQKTVKTWIFRSLQDCPHSLAQSNLKGLNTALAHNFWLINWPKSERFYKRQYEYLQMMENWVTTMRLYCAFVFLLSKTEFCTLVHLYIIVSSY